MSKELNVTSDCKKYLGPISYVTVPKCLEICTLTINKSNPYGRRTEREHFFRSQMCSEHYLHWTMTFSETLAR